MKKILLLSSLIFINLHSFAQLSFEPFKGLEVKEGNNQILKNPFAGGLDAPQFSECDLNFDGIKDLVVFDREGTRISTFLNDGIANTISYTYAPEYEKNFPKIQDWMLLVDYNKDGKEDIFTAAPGGVRVYLNNSTPTSGLNFNLKYNFLYCDYGTINTVLYVEQQDIPAILDVDGDGDIDILTFYKSIDTTGESIYWYKNLAVENYGGSDTLVYEVGKECWGRFRESYSNCVPNLQYSGGVCGTGGRGIRDLNESELKELFTQNKSSDAKHAGSTLLIFDANNDGLIDLLVGDISCNNMYILYNTNTNLSPIFTSTNLNYPTSNPINVPIFPASFYLDVNNDGKKDLLIAPNTPNSSDNFENILVYLRNDSTSGENIFNLHSNNFLASEMIDVGEGAYPTFVDYNNDGLKDIIISNTGYFTGSGTYTTGLALYENYGSADSPKFTLISRDWQNLSTLNISNMAVNFADLDADGDLDMISGSNNGEIYFFRNIAGPNQSINLEFVPNYFNGIDVGNVSTPFAYDLDNNGKLEIIVGERFYNINLVVNNGTPTNPNYVLATDSLWKINMGKFVAFPSGRTSIQISNLNPNSNEKYLLISNGNGSIYYTKNLPANYTDSIENFYSANSILLNMTKGQYAGSNSAFGISVSDINNDHLNDIIAGTPQGGLLLFKNTSIFQSIDPSIVNNNNVYIYPNPFKDNIHIQSNDLIKKINVIDINGRKILEKDINKYFDVIDLTTLDNGMYIIESHTAKSINRTKIIK